MQINPVNSTSYEVTSPTKLELFLPIPNEENWEVDIIEPCESMYEKVLIPKETTIDNLTELIRISKMCYPISDVPSFEEEFEELFDVDRRCGELKLIFDEPNKKIMEWIYNDQSEMGWGYTLIIRKDNISFQALYCSLDCEASQETKEKYLNMLEQAEIR